jgi:hypothetical protein
MKVIIIYGGQFPGLEKSILNVSFFRKLEKILFWILPGN